MGQLELNEHTMKQSRSASIKTKVRADLDSPMEVSFRTCLCGH